MKFMESFLANRPKVGAPESDPSAPALDDAAYSGLLGGDVGGFGDELPQSGGFQSLRTALLEAGSVVSARHRDQQHHSSSVEGASKETQSDLGSEGVVHQEPTVELITNEGRIEKVIVTCSCCRRIELDCTY